MSPVDEAATVYGVGTGPGDPALLTLKAVDTIATCPVVAYFCKRAGQGNALTTVNAHLRADHCLLPMVYPVTTELPHDCDAYRDAIEGFFDEAATQVAAHVAAGRSVAVLSEGDPFFYGSFMHIFLRLRDRLRCEVVPGVPAMLAGASRLPRPIAMRDDVLSVIPGTLPDRELAQALAVAQAAVVMKVGRNLARIRAALVAIDAIDRAWYIERASHAGRERVLPLADVDTEQAPYFSMVLLPGEGKRR